MQISCICWAFAQVNTRTTTISPATNAATTGPLLTVQSGITSAATTIVAVDLGPASGYTAGASAMTLTTASTAVALSVSTTGLATAATGAAVTSDGLSVSGDAVLQASASLTVTGPMEVDEVVTLSSSSGSTTIASVASTATGSAFTADVVEAVVATAPSPSDSLLSLTVGGTSKFEVTDRYMIEVFIIVRSASEFTACMMRCHDVSLQVFSNGDVAARAGLQAHAGATVTGASTISGSVTVRSQARVH